MSIKASLWMVLPLVMSGCSMQTVIGQESLKLASTSNPEEVKSSSDCYSYEEAPYLYDDAYSITHNGIDEDGDNTIDEADEVLVLVRKEWSDGIDNNGDGQIDEPYEYTPTTTVTVCSTYSIDTSVEDGTIIITENYQTITTKTPYQGQSATPNIDLPPTTDSKS